MRGHPKLLGVRVNWRSQISLGFSRSLSVSQCRNTLYSRSLVTPGTSEIISEMKQLRVHQEFFFTVLATSIATVLAKPTPENDLQVFGGKPSPGELLVRRQKTTSTCLRIAPDLPPCNFDSQATWRSTSGEILHGGPGEATSEVFQDGRTAAERESSADNSIGNIEDLKIYKKDLAITIVYYLEGCMPYRLPFDLPSCPIEELQTIQMNKLVPFKLPDDQDALIFPEIDVKEIEFAHRHSLVHSSPSQGMTDVQNLNRMAKKNTMNPSTGMESTKYASRFPTSGGSAQLGDSMTSEFSCGFSENCNNNDVNVAEEGPGIILEFQPLDSGDISEELELGDFGRPIVRDEITEVRDDRDDEEGEPFGKDKNRVQ
ncbi:uncharacterized protein LOC105688136 isoform X2 [Athalia rosae]|uniref:uncharacterized protein LOC105688136 isoform X2 n=1 Tax=Athalia rosae TaxID=37344 RepID=UPI0020345C03|nr:uncharacterized protein LOC105688136 isoform X2 [Athalia rosae]